MAGCFVGKPLEAYLQSTWTIIVTLEKASDSTTDWSVCFKTPKCMLWVHLVTVYQNILNLNLRHIQKYV